jgi:hypothetical protein
MDQNGKPPPSMSFLATKPKDAGIFREILDKSKATSSYASPWNPDSDIPITAIKV